MDFIKLLYRFILCVTSEFVFGEISQPGDNKKRALLQEQMLVFFRKKVLCRHIMSNFFWKLPYLDK